MAKKLTNKEVLTQIAAMNDVDANQYGVSADMRSMAARAASGDASAAASFYSAYTPLFNAFCGFIVKFALTALSKAFYYDVYAEHHRNMLQGRPELGFVKKAKTGTGNHSKQFAADPATGSLTTVVTAAMPDVVALYDITVASYEARIPVSIEDVKTAFTNEYGINDLYVKVREGLEGKIIEDRNATYDTKLTAIAGSLIAAGTGSEIDANAAKATYVSIAPGADWSTIVTNRAYGSLTEDQLTQVFVQIKRLFYGMTSRPNGLYNALGVDNNAPKDQVIVYIDADLYAEMSRVKATAFNPSALEAEGLKIKPIIAPWIGKIIDSKPILAAIGARDFIRDYPTSDFGTSVPTDRGSIESRFMDTQLCVAGYEPFCFLVGDTTPPTPPTPSVKTFKLTSITVDPGLTDLVATVYGVKDGVTDTYDGADCPVADLSGLLIQCVDATSGSMVDDVDIQVLVDSTPIVNETMTAGTVVKTVQLTDAEIELIDDAITVYIGIHAD